MMGCTFGRDSRNRKKNWELSHMCTLVGFLAFIMTEWEPPLTHPPFTCCYSLLNRLVEALSRPALSHRLFSLLSISPWERERERGGEEGDGVAMTMATLPKWGSLRYCGFNWISLRKNKKAVESSDMNAMKLRLLSRLAVSTSYSRSLCVVMND